MASKVIAGVSASVSRMAKKMRAVGATTAGLSKSVGGSFASIGRRASAMGLSVVTALSGAIKKLLKFGAVAAAIGGAAFAAIISKASEMQETMGKFDVVFGSNSETMKKWSNETADSLGTTRQEMAGMLSGMQDLLVPMGVAEGQATGMSKEMAKLAVDLGSFNNMSTDQVFGDLQAAMTGSGEVMKKYGVVLTEAGIKQEALNMGLDPKKLTDAQKAQARLNIIMRGTTAAQGDALRTQDSFANQLKRVKSNISNLAVSLGGPFLEGLSGVAQAINTQLKAAFNFIESRADTIKGFAEGVANVLKRVVGAVAGFVKGFTSKVAGNMDIIKGWALAIKIQLGVVRDMFAMLGGVIAKFAGKGMAKLGGFRAFMQRSIRAQITVVTLFETALKNLPLVFDILKNSAALKMTTLGLDIKHTFTKVVPHAFKVFGVLVANTFKGIVRATTGLFEKMIDTVIGLMRKVESIDPTGMVTAHIAALEKGSEFLGIMQDSLADTAAPAAVGPRARSPIEDILQGDLNKSVDSFAGKFQDALAPRLAKLDAIFAPKVEDGGIFDNLKKFGSDFWAAFKAGSADATAEETTAATAVATKVAPALQATQSRLLTRGRTQNTTVKILDESKKQTAALKEANSKLADLIPSTAVDETKLVMVGP